MTHPECCPVHRDLLNPLPDHRRDLPEAGTVDWIRLSPLQDSRRRISDEMVGIQQEAVVSDRRLVGALVQSGHQSADCRGMFRWQVEVLGTVNRSEEHNGASPFRSREVFNEFAFARLQDPDDWKARSGKVADLLQFGLDFRPRPPR